MSALTGAAAPTKLKYPAHYASNGFTNNAAQVFLEAPDKPELSFAGQGRPLRRARHAEPRTWPALSRVTGPIGGNVQDAMTNAAVFDVGQFFAGVPARAVRDHPAQRAFRARRTSPRARAEVRDAGARRRDRPDAERASESGTPRTHAHAAPLGAAATNARRRRRRRAARRPGRARRRPQTTRRTSRTTSSDLAGTLEPFIRPSKSAADHPAARRRKQLAGVVPAVQDQLEDAAAVARCRPGARPVRAGAEAAGSRHRAPRLVDRSRPWPVRLPRRPDLPPARPARAARSRSRSSSRRRRAPASSRARCVSCSLSPFELRLIGSATFLVLHFDVIEFSIAARQEAGRRT